MATNTPFLNLRKPDGVDLVNYLADLDDNYDKIDAGVLAVAKPRRARVSRVTAQAVGSAVSSAMVWTIVDYDTAVFWAAGQPSRLTCAVAGTYNFSFGAQFAISAAGGQRSLFLQRTTAIGGVATIIAISHFTPNASWYCGGTVECDMNMAVGDYVECMAYHNAGAVLNLDPAYVMWATAKLVGLP
jgi:hypothetical protein